MLGAVLWGLLFQAWGYSADVAAPRVSASYLQVRVCTVVNCCHVRVRVRERVYLAVWAVFMCLHVHVIVRVRVCVCGCVCVQAKEWLRRTLIGRDVTVAVEYTRAGAPGGAGEGGGESGAPPERTFATVTFATKKGDTVNVAVQLIGMLHS